MTTIKVGYRLIKINDGEVIEGAWDENATEAIALQRAEVNKRYFETVIVERRVRRITETVSTKIIERITKK